MTARWRLLGRWYWEHLATEKARSDILGNILGVTGMLTLLVPVGKEAWPLGMGDGDRDLEDLELRPSPSSLSDLRIDFIRLEAKDMSQMHERKYSRTRHSYTADCGLQLCRTHGH